MHTIKHWLLAAGLMASSSLLLAEDFTTNIVDGVDVSANGFEVGQWGSYNYLEVRNGGVASCWRLGVNEGANHNAAVITGQGSRLTNSLYEIGYYSAYNSVIVTNGGLVQADSLVTIGFMTNANFNSVSVTGSNSLWSVAGSITVGWRGHGNRLSLFEGARVLCTYASLGVSDSASNNVALVTDPGTEWQCSTYNFLEVGNASSGNCLIVSNQARVSSNGGIIGELTNASNNKAWVVGTNSVWTNSLSFTVGSSGSANQLTITEGARLHNTYGYVGFSAGSLSNSAVIDGPGSRWVNNELLSIGVFGSCNQLLITNSAIVQSKSGSIGANSGACSNQVVITGAGSLWTNSAISQFTVGGGSANRLVVSQGAQLINQFFAVIGDSRTANGNAVVVADAGSRWSSGNLLFILGGSGNSLSVSNGGTVTSPGVYLGWDNSTNNLLRVDGGNLMVTNGIATLDVRQGQFTMTAGLTAAGLLLATDPTKGTIVFQGGTLRVTNSLVTNAAPLTVGDGSRVAMLELLGGTNVFRDGLGISPAAVLTGTGAIEAAVTNRGTLLARANSGGQLEIRGQLKLMPGSQSSFEIVGAAAGSYGAVNVTNTISFDGTLQVSLVSGFSPASTDTFTLMRFASATGAFANAPGGSRLMTADGSGSFRVRYTAAALILDDFRTGLLILNSRMAPATHNFTMQFNSITGKTYRVWSSTNLTDWTEIASPTFTVPAPGLWQWMDADSQTPGSRRFYRLSTE